MRHLCRPDTFRAVRFYLGTVDPGWLAREEFEGVDLFVSRNRLIGHVTEGLRADALVPGQRRLHGDIPSRHVDGPAP